MPPFIFTLIIFIPKKIYHRLTKNILKFNLDVEKIVYLYTKLVEIL